MQRIDATLGEQSRMGLGVAIDLVAARARCFACKPILKGTRKHFAASRLHGLDDARILVQALSSSSLRGKFLFDQRIQHVSSGLFREIRSQPWLTLQQQLNLVNRDLVLVDPRRDLYIHRLVPATTAQHGDR